MQTKTAKVELVQTVHFGAFVTRSVVVNERGTSHTFVIDLQSIVNSRGGWCSSKTERHVDSPGRCCHVVWPVERRGRRDRDNDSLRRSSQLFIVIAAVVVRRRPVREAVTRVILVTIRVRLPGVCGGGFLFSAFWNARYAHWRRTPPSSNSVKTNSSLIIWSSLLGNRPAHGNSYRLSNCARTIW